MPATIPTAVILLKTINLALGGAITTYAWRAYRRTRQPALRALFLGFGTVTLGTLTAGIADQILPVTRDLALLVESAFIALGFATILYSLFAE